LGFCLVALGLLGFAGGVGLAATPALLVLELLESFLSELF
jgi:hypothetical protein